MRVGLLVPGGMDRSGEHRVIPCVLALVERLARRHDVRVLALLQQPAGDDYPLRGARVHSLDVRGGPIRALRAALRLHRRVGFDLLHALWATPSGAFAAVLGRMIRRPLLLHLCGGELVSLPAIAYGGQLTARRRAMVRMATRGARLVTASCPALVHEAAARGIAARQVVLGVDLDRWPVRPPRPRDTSPRLLHVASLNRVKDQGTLLRAAARLRDRGTEFHLDMVGDDAVGGTWQRLAGELGLGDQVTFHGFRTHAQLRPLVDRAHLLVMSSLHEGGEMVTLEAAVAGVPAVGTAVGHVQWLAPGAALAVPVGDAEALARGIATLLEDDPLRLAIAAEAQRIAVRHDADRTAGEVERLYEEIAAAS